MFEALRKDKVGEGQEMLDTGFRNRVLMRGKKKQLCKGKQALTTQKGGLPIVISPVQVSDEPTAELGV